MSDVRFDPPGTYADSTNTGSKNSVHILKKSKLAVIPQCKLASNDFNIYQLGIQHKFIRIHYYHSIKIDSQTTQN